MYRGRYDKPTPPGYSGVAFAPSEAKDDEKTLKKSPTPVGSGAGDKAVKNNAGRVQNGSIDPRNEIKRLPRDFSGKGEAKTVSSGEADDGYAMLASLFQRKISLEDLLLLGTALLLATKEDRGEAFPMFALALMLLDS